MKFRPLTAIGLGLALALSGQSYAQVLGNDDKDPAAVDDRAGDATKDGDATQDRGGSSSPLGANPARQSLSFGVLDVNTDGKLSKDEARADGTLTTRFDQLDADRSGSLSDGEFAKFEASGDAKQKKSKDTNRSAPGEQAEDKAKRESRNAEDEIEDTRD